jgi:hypothetical protein
MTAIAPDPAQLNRFVRAMFARASEGGVISLRAFFDDVRAKRSGERPFGVRAVRLNGSLEPVVQEAIRLAVAAARAVRPVVVAPPIATFRTAKADTGNLAEGLVLSIELDERPNESLTALKAVIGPPTLVIASGGQWTDSAGEVHDRLHVHYRLAEPTIDPDGHQRLKRARSLACDLVLADATSKSPVHPMRWPGTVHRKDPNAPRLARIVEQNDTEIALDLVLAELEGLAALRGKAAGSGHDDPASRDVALLMACAKAIPNAGLSWALWNRFGMAFFAASDGQEYGFDAFETFSAKSSKHDPPATRARWEHSALRRRN